MYNQCIK